MICPKCGMEFVEGVTHCSDCNVPLVAPSEIKKETEAFMTMPTELAKKLTDFLNYSEIYAEVAESEDETMSVIFVEVGSEKYAKKLTQVFLKEQPIEIQETEEDVEEEEPIGTYILAKDKHSDSNSTFWMLGGAALIVIGMSLKNTITGIISGTIYNPLSLVVFWLMGLLLVWGTVKYYKITKEVKERISIEETWHTQVSAWLIENFTAESIDANVIAIYGETQEEIFILNRYEYLKKETRGHFAEVPVGFLDLEIENFYEMMFE